MNEVGIIYFPQKEKEEDIKRKQAILEEHTRILKEKSQSNQKKKIKKKEPEHLPSQAMFFSMGKDINDENKNNTNIMRSQNIALNSGKKESRRSHKTNEVYTYKNQQAQNTFGPTQLNSSHKPERGPKDSKNKTHKPTSVSNKRKDSIKRQNLSKTNENFGPRYDEVESKIKDEVQFQKGLSKQYKKMRENMRHYDSQADNHASMSSDIYRNHQNYEDKDAIYQEHSQQLSRNQSVRYGDSKLIDSASSVHRSLHFPHYSGQLFDRAGDEAQSAFKHRRNETLPKNDEFSYHKSVGGGDNQGGIMDIANSFLNSPLMQNLSNIDRKDSEESSKISSPIKKTNRNKRITNFESKSPQTLKSPKKFGGDDEFKYLEIQSAKNHYYPVNHQHKYSDWVGIYKTENQDQDSEQSERREYQVKPTKDSSIV